MEYPFSWTLSNYADEEIFVSECKLIEQHIPEVYQEYNLEDVDGSLVRKYKHRDGTIIVRSDCQADAVYIDSDFDLLPYFPTK